MTTYTIRFSMEFTLLRFLTALLLYAVGILAVWPPTWVESAIVVLCATVLVATIWGPEVERQ